MNRKNTSSISAMTILKEVIINYRNNITNVHCTMLDLSKAFDRAL